MSVWLSVSVSVCPLTYLKNHVSKFHKIRTSGFVDDATFSHNGPPKNYILRSFLSACLFNTSACKKILFDFKHLQWLDVLSMCIIYLLHPRQQLRNIVMSTLDHSITRVRVCLSVCKNISGTTRANFTNFCVCCLWLWLGPPPASLRYVMYFRFCRWHHVSFL